MNFCRYNTNCPICRQRPDGVEEHTENVSIALPSSPPRAATFVLDIEEVTQEIEDAIEEQRRSWRRYRNRRRRALNNHPHLKTLFERLQLLRREILELHDTTQRAYTRRCREVWRTDADLVERRRTLTRLQRRERRIERSLYDQLRGLVGSEP